MICRIETIDKKIKKNDNLQYDAILMLHICQLYKLGLFPIKIEAFDTHVIVTTEVFNKEHEELYDNVVRKEMPFFFKIRQQLAEKLKDEVVSLDDVTSKEIRKALLDNADLQEAIDEREQKINSEK